MNRMLGAALIGALALAATACAPAPPASAAKDASATTSGASQAAGQALTVTLTDMQFTPASVTVKAGTPVNFVAANKGVVDHNWHVTIGNETIQIDARPGQTATKTFTPTTAGTYTVVCTVPGHEPAGMRGTLIVQ